MSGVEMKIKWPLTGDGDVTVYATRSLSDKEFQTFLQVVQLARSGFVDEPATDSPRTIDGEIP